MEKIYIYDYLWYNLSVTYLTKHVSEFLRIGFILIIISFWMFIGLIPHPTDWPRHNILSWHNNWTSPIKTTLKFTNFYIACYYTIRCVTIDCISIIKHIMVYMIRLYVVNYSAVLINLFSMHIKITM